MKTELTRSDLNKLQDALAYKLLYLKDHDTSRELTRMDALPVMRLISKLEAMKEEKDEDCTRAECHRVPGAA